ncbi:MAG: DUF4292 domain-containing protein [Bacteroidales bacterium]|jgi:hypothetical protein|nr:DUF4292 domain-containing protein [Bacteroidales bacterium]
MNRPLQAKQAVTRASVYLVLLVLVNIIGGCSSKRQIIKEPLKEAGSTYLLEKLAENELKFDWFSAKFSIDYIYDKKLTEFKGQIRIRKDSIIWLSFSPALGIEMARLKITNDSVFFMNRINKTYLKGDYKFINDYLQTNIDFDILQSFVIGNDFQFYEKTRFRAFIDNQEYRLSTMERHKLKNYVKQDETIKAFIQNIWLNPDNFKITRVNIREFNNDKRLDALYGNFKEHEGQLFPFDIIFEITADEKIIVEVDYSRITIGEALSFPFTIPSKYERIY